MGRLCFLLSFALQRVRFNVCIGKFQKAQPSDGPLRAARGPIETLQTVVPQQMEETGIRLRLEKRYYSEAYLVPGVSRP
jgi:hypothetical protein